MSGGTAPSALAVVGATATGKTELALAVALRLGGEIIGLDSRQAYRGLAVGTAAPEFGQLHSVPHHGIGFLDPRESYSAGHFARLARRWIRQIRGRGRVPILAGGTGFFLRALLEPVFEEPPLDAESRRRLREWLEDQPAELVGRWARRLDPERVASLEVLDRQRAGRAIELALLSGRGLSWWYRHGEPEARPVPMLVYGLGLPPDVHRERIRRRVERLLDGGWLEEVRGLREAGVPPDAPAMGAVGYLEIAALLAGELERDAAVAEIARRTWGYARRQRTWFRHQLPGLRWLDATLPIDELAERVAREWAAAGRDGGR